MRLAVVWLLALLLAACSDPEPAAQSEPEVVVQSLPTEPETADATVMDAAPADEPEPESALDPAELPDTAGDATADSSLEPVPVASAPIPLTPGRAAAQDASLPQLSIIIDDVGHGLAQGRRVIQLPGPVALAILPHTLAAQTLAAEARAAGKPMMLHLPMENQGGLPIGPGGLYARMSREEFDRVLVQSLDSIEGIQGVNNHMGSLLTTLRPQMDWLMEQLAARDLFFVDSRTSAETQAAAAAQARGIPQVSRHVFLDNLRTPEHLARSFEQALQVSRSRGYAVLIGHPYPETLAFLEQRLEGIEAREGVRLVPIEALLDRQP